jgi:MarR family transcriptional regulator, organic hydroperoxide resistance regulator
MNKKQVTNVGQLQAADMTGYESWLSVVRAYAWCEKNLSAGLDPLGLSIAQHDILANVVRDPGMTQAVLAKRLLVTRSNVSMLLTQMTREGLIERRASETDARANCLYLTKLGSRLVSQSLAVQARVVRIMLAETNDTESRVIRAAMDRMSVALQAELGRIELGKTENGKAARLKRIKSR